MVGVQGSVGAQSLIWRRTALIGGVLIACGLLATAYAVGIRVQSVMQEQTARAIDQENVQFCAELNLEPDSATHAACIEGLDDVRQRHKERIYVKLKGFL